MKKTGLIILTVLFFICDLPAQPGRGPQVDSPLVHPDNTVTFQLLAPAAKVVLLDGQFAREPSVMEKDSSGIWKVTVGPIKPDMYPYHFIVDGVPVADPRNVAIFPNEAFQNSIVEITGDKTLVHTVQNVPHGIVSYRYYHSPELGMRPVVIYTPPGYDKNPQLEYPVLYLLHGTTDTEETWTKVGRAHIILDNLIYQEKAVPMIIVMPYGRAYPVISKHSGSLRNWENLQEFKKDFFNNLVPFIEDNYRIKADGDNRAIAGFSGGGGTSLYLGLNNTDFFHWVVGFAPGMRVEEIDRNNAGAFEDPQLTNNRLKLFWIAVGKEDRLGQFITPYLQVLDQKGITYEFFQSEGGHTWMNCKLYLSVVVQKLFK